MKRVKAVAALIMALMLVCVPTLSVFADTQDHTETGTQNEATESEYTSAEGTASEAADTEDEDIILEAVAEDGMRVKLTADSDAFETAEGLELKAELITGERAEAAGDEIDRTAEDENVAKRVTYDIRVEKDGAELEPVDGKKVSVEFVLCEAPDGADGVSIFHHDEEEGIEKIAEASIEEEITDGEDLTVSDNAAVSAGNESDDVCEEELAETDDIEIENDLVVDAEVDSFSFYTVDFTYEEKTISIDGDTSGNSLDDIVSRFGIESGVEYAAAYQDADCSTEAAGGAVKNAEGETLYRVYESEGIWYLDAVNAFTTEHGLKIRTADGAEYKFKVTDTSSGWTEFGTCEYQIDGTGVLTVRPIDNGASGTLGGTTFYSPWKNNTSITKVKFENGVIAGKSLYQLFYGCTGITEIDLGDLDTSNTEKMSSMFSKCTALESIDVSRLNTSKATEMGGMFYKCQSLTSIDVSKFNTSNVTDMKQMFCDCEKITSLDVSKFDTSNVTDMKSMFGGCCKLTSLDVSRFNTSKVSDMRYMFSHCEALTSLNTDNFDTSKVTDMDTMFSGCKALMSLDLSSFDTSKVLDMQYMFSGCEALKNLDVSSFDTSKVSDMSYMFYGCKKIKSLNLGGFDTSAVTYMQWMFKDCTDLSKLTLKAGAVYQSDCGLTGEWKIQYATDGQIYTPDTLIAKNKTLTSNATYLKVSELPEYFSTWPPQIFIDDSNIFYDGTEKKPVPVVKSNEATGGFLLVEGVDYEITGYDNNINAGTNTATVWISGKGNYSGIASQNFSIHARTSNNPGSSTSGSGGSGVVTSANGTWKFVNGYWQYIVSGQPLKDVTTWIAYTWTGGKSYAGRFKFNSLGNMLIGWQQVDGDWCFFETTVGPTLGMMKTGWYTDPKSGYTYYFDKDGKAVTGWREINKKWYYFATVQDLKNRPWAYDPNSDQWSYRAIAAYPVGIMWVNTSTPDGYKVGADGAWVR